MTVTGAKEKSFEAFNRMASTYDKSIYGRYTTRLHHVIPSLSQPLDQGLVEEKLVEVDVEDEKEGRMKVDIYVD